MTERAMMTEEIPNSLEVTEATIQGPHGTIPFHLFKSDVCFQITNDIFAGATYPLVSFVSGIKTILDVGANVGAASVYFASAYPKAQLYAFEPGSAPLSLLQQNSKPLRNVRVFPFGLYSSDKNLSLFHGRNDPVEASVCPTTRTAAAAEQIRLRRASDVLQEHGIESVDLLKLDTEGCEVPILQSLIEYLPSVKVLYVEYHSERDRRLIDGIVAETHVLWSGNVRSAYRGEFCYLKRDLVPDESETHSCEILLNLE